MIHSLATIFPRSGARRQERLEREFDLDIIASAPSVEYIVTLNHGAGELKVENPALLPDPGEIESIAEPWVKLSIVTPATYIGSLMELGTNHRGTFLDMEYLDPTRVLMNFELPLAEVVVDFFDQMKSRTQGYASLDYELAGYRPSNLVKVDLLLNGVPADAFSTIVHRDSAYDYGRRNEVIRRHFMPYRELVATRPWYVAWGNHDVMTDGGNELRRRRPVRYHRPQRHRFIRAKPSIFPRGVLRTAGSCWANSSFRWRSGSSAGACRSTGLPRPA